MDIEPVPVIFKKACSFSTSLNGFLGSYEEDLQNQNGINTLTCFNLLLGIDEKDMQNHNVILTLTSLNGLLGSGEKEMLNQNGILIGLV